MRREIVPQRHRGPGSSVRILTAVFVLAVLAVVCAILLAPRKPPAPPASAISYTQRPEAPQPYDEGSTDTASDQRPGRRKRVGEKADAASGEPAASTGRYVVFGRVTDAKTGAPVEDALVRCLAFEPGAVEAATKTELRPTREGARGISNADGEYAMRLEQTGWYEVQVHRVGYMGMKSERREVTEKAVAPGGLQIDFKLSRGASVSGRVHESSGGAGAVRVKLYAEGPVRSEGETDKDGAYTISGLSPGDYAVNLNLQRTAYLIGGRAPTRNVTISQEDEDLTGIDFTVDAAGEVWGYVVTRDGEAMKDVPVVLCTSASVISQLADASIKKEAPLTDASDKEGYFELLGVPLNQEWRLYAMANKSAPQLTAPFLLTPRQRSARIDIYVSPGTTVYGRVVDTKHKPIEKADVACIPGYSKLFSPFDTPQAFRNMTSKDDGTFEIANLPLGEYQILARKKGFKFAAIGEPIFPDGFNDIRNVQVVLTPVEGGVFDVYGAVTDAKGTAIEGVRVTLSALGTEDLSAGERDSTTDGQGAFSFSGVQSGFLVLRAEKQGYQGQHVTNVKLNEPTNIVLQASSHVSGTVIVRETGAAPPACQVSAVQIAQSTGEQPDLMSFLAQSAGSRSVQTSNGAFEMDLDAGAYMLEARAAGLTPGRTHVTLEAGKTEDGVKIYLNQSGGRIAGRVATVDGRSVQGALVWTLQGDAPAEMLAAMADDTQQRGVQVGADGTYEFPNLASGAYTILAKLEGYAQGRVGPVQVGDGQDVPGVDVVLRPGSSLEGYVSFNGRMEAGALILVSGNTVSERATSDANGYYRVDRLPPGAYLASAVSLAGTALAGYASVLSGRVEIVEGQTTTYNFGEPTNTALIGLCTPGPAPNVSAVAILHTPGMPLDPNGLGLDNLAGMLQGGSSLADYVVGLVPVERDGYFRMDNLVEGQYILEVFYVPPGLVYSAPVAVTNGQIVNVDVPVVPVRQ